MRIFYYCHVELSGQTGSIGSVRHVVEVINRLSDRNHDVVLFAPKPKGETDNLKTDETLYFNRREGYVGFVKEILECSYLMTRELIKDAPDAIYAREMLYTAHTAIFSTIFNIPHLIEINGFQPEEIKTDDDFDEVLFPLLVLGEGLNYWLSDCSLAVSERTRKKVQEYYSLPGEKITTIRNGVNTDRCRPMDQSKARQEVDIDPEANWIGFLGYLFPWSGVDYLIKSAPQIIEEHPTTKFMVVGSGTWGEELPELAREEGMEEHFYFTGEIPWDQVPVHLNCLDIGVSPYTGERNTLDSLKTYEYMACGLPVVCSDVGDLRELVEENQAGVMVEPENEENLAKEIITLLANPDIRNAMAKRARKVVRENYDWDHTVRETEALLLQLTN